MKVNSGFVAVSVALVAPGMAGGVSVDVGSGAIVTSNVAPVGHGSIVFLPPTVVSPVATYLFLNTQPLVGLSAVAVSSPLVGLYSTVTVIVIAPVGETLST